MEPVTVVRGRACPIDANDVDTDAIIPKQFLKRVERTGFGPFAFSEWRYLDDGSPNPDFAMNRPEHAGANILLAGRNFGCGSSREHAPWALEDAGFRAIIASSFADIFRTNCGKIGVLAVQLGEPIVRQLFAVVDADPSVEITVDLEQQLVRVPQVGDLAGVDAHFDIDPHTRHCLLHGLDDIGLTLQDADAIDAYEADRAAYKPRVPAR
ncbi:3-isopropylmalate dehydratase small subunit [Egicoccus halophilus]|uniref:3-isopropylmalate dehydratase small subunit n=1 Tax=Egicoccus halophilus TaxID=1670830 RepID=A0A8J3ADS1_9ACTN|nr:3-isopropylmalate dehydratase small subunit [Egicoccus halophilus]GGI06306.1 3-isopropylmalate dehydratase small subunit [Egicoccus halophilus]